jgi:adenylylsulfate kinase-like enzyme
MSDELPDVYFGRVSTDKVNWRGVLPANEPDDDDELTETPADVVGMLGFDPLDESDEDDEEFDKSVDEYIERWLGNGALEKFDPDQPRDEKGQWTDSGGGLSSIVTERISGEKNIIAEKVKRLEAAKKAHPERFPADPKDNGADLERYVAEVKQTAEYKEIMQRFATLTAETKSGDITQWSKEKNSDKWGDYNLEREVLHETLVSRVLTDDTIASEGEQPIAVLLIGPTGVGKTTSGIPEAEKLAGPDRKLAHIDCDWVKERLPEYEGWNAAAVHKESTDVAEHKMLPQAIANNHNLVYDATGKNEEKMVAAAEKLHKAGYDVHVILVTAELKTSVSRTWERFAIQGLAGGKESRFVDLEFAKKMNGYPQETFKTINERKLVNSAMRVNVQEDEKKIEHEVYL